MAEASSLAVLAKLRHEEYPSSDHYVGSAEALIAAGLITADQLPGQPGMNRFMCTFYDGALVKKGAHFDRDERHLCIRRAGKKFVITKGVSEQVGKQRRAAAAAEREREQKALYEEQKRQEASKRTPDDFRESCSSAVDLVRRRVDGGSELDLFKFAPDARARIEEALRGLEALIRGSQVLPVHPASASAGKGRLRLAWSAS